MARAGTGGIIDDAFLEHLGHASILHDIGKVAIPESVLLKPGSLDAAEREIINTHAVIGHEMLKKAAALAMHGDARLFHLASEVARSHHERFDGSGYPDGLKGSDIPLSARIVAVVDVFDALISHRPYKTPWSVDKALELISREAGRHFDPDVVAAFIAVNERKAASRIIDWSAAMSVGHDELDRDHRRLIGILNSLGISAELGNRSIIEFILDDLADYTQIHFRREERHLETLDFPGYDDHRAVHERISRRIEEAKWKYFQGCSPELQSELLEFLGAWLNNHILVEDMKYKDEDQSA
jgi:hemerythrin-like metal-binding protein